VSARNRVTGAQIKAATTSALGTGLKGASLAALIERFYGELKRWPMEPDGHNPTQAQIVAICQHISDTGDCLWHAKFIVGKEPCCHCSNCRPVSK
jgi:hypothetical protein